MIFIKSWLEKIPKAKRKDFIKNILPKLLLVKEKKCLSQI